MNHSQQVLFMGRTQNYLGIPSPKLQRRIDSGDIVSKEGNDHCSNAFVYPDHEQRRWLYRNKGRSLDWTMYWNSLAPLE